MSRTTGRISPPLVLRPCVRQPSPDQVTVDVQRLQPPAPQRGDPRHRPRHAAAARRLAGVPTAAPDWDQEPWPDPAAAGRWSAGLVLGALEPGPAGQPRG